MRTTNSRQTGILHLEAAVSNTCLHLTSDDPTLVVLTIRFFALTGIVLELPAIAPLGKTFRIRVLTDITEDPSYNTSQDITVRARSIGTNGTTTTYTYQVGQGQDWVEFVFTKRGWLFPTGATNLLSGTTWGPAYGMAWGDGAIAHKGNSTVNNIAIGRNARSVSTGSVAIGDSATSSGGGIAIGKGTAADADGGVSIGYQANGTSSGNGSGVAVGYNANGNDRGCGVGNGASGGNQGVGIGKSASGGAAVAVGVSATALNQGVAIGNQANAGNNLYNVALGSYSISSRRNEVVKGLEVNNGSKKFMGQIGGWTQTTNATPAEMFTDNNAGTRITMPNSSAMAFQGTVIARNNTDDVVSGWKVEGVIKRGANAAATALTGATVAVLFQDAGAATWAVALTADTTNGSLKFTVTGEAAKTINWVFQLNFSHVGF